MPRIAPAITLNPVTDSMLQHLVRSPSTPQALALRSRIVLAASTGRSTRRSPRRSGSRKSPPGSGGARLRRPGSTGCRMPRERGGRPNMARRCGNASKSGSASNPRPTVAGRCGRWPATWACPPRRSMRCSARRACSRIGCGPFRSVRTRISKRSCSTSHSLRAFLLQYLATYNATSVPFTWTKGPEKLQSIIEATKAATRTAIPKRRRRRRPSRRPANTVKN